MEQIATRKNTVYLQRLFDVVGTYGGTIETYEPGTWWTLDIEVESIEDDKKKVMIGVFNNLNGDIIYDPLFHLSITMNGERLGDVEIIDCEETTVLGTTIVDNNDMLHGFGMVEKDEFGLKQRFSSFIDNMASNGPYISNPKKVTKYNKTLADY